MNSRETRPSTAGSQLVGIQYLRAIGALLVVQRHATIQIPVFTAYFDKYLLGNAHLSNGVDLFFVISGFIMLVSSRRSSPGEFLIKRLIRIVPLYWVLTILLVVTASWLPALFRTTVVGFEYIVKSLLFIPYANPGHDGAVVPLLMPGWTLNFELFFYLLYSLSLFAAPRMRVALVGAVFATLMATKYLFDFGQHFKEIGFLIDLRLFEFWLGMVIAQLFVTKSLRLPTMVSWLLVIGGIAALLWGFPMLPLSSGGSGRFVVDSIIPSAIIVLGMVSLDQSGHIRRVRPFEYLGDASYSIYLSHIFSLGVLRVAWAKLGLEHGSATYATAFAIASLIIAIIGGAICYRYLETPMLRGLQGWYRRHRASEAAVSMSPLVHDR